MLKVLILEDNNLQRKTISQIVQNRIMINNTDKSYDMEIAISTDNPVDAINYVENHREEMVLAFLDIDLKNKQINGLDIAEHIRQYLRFAEIVFVTTHQELMPLTLRKKVAPLDFIDKDNNMTDQIRECVDIAYKHYQKEISGPSKSTLTYEIMNGIYKQILIEKIYSFESIKGNNRHIKLIAEDAVATIIGNLRDIEQKNEELFRCNRNTVINLINIEQIDLNSKIIKLKNSSIYNISTRKIKDIKKILKSR